MIVTLTCSDGTVLGEYEVKNGKLRLRSGDEGTIWGREATRLGAACRHIEALKSGRITIERGKMFMDDGSPVTDEIMAYWGWRETETGWVNP